MKAGAAVFDEVVALTGVSSVLAPGMVTRSLADFGVTVDDATLDHYEDALPRLKARLKAYIPEDEAEARTQAILARIVALRGTPARPAASGPIRIRPISTPPGADALPPRSGVSVVAASADAHGAYEDDDHTLTGRRWTADERAVIDAHRAKTTK